MEGIDEAEVLKEDLKGSNLSVFIPVSDITSDGLGYLRYPHRDV